MRISTTISLMAGLLAERALANLDVVSLQAKSSAYIQEAEATVVLGDIPNPRTGDVALWSAIMMEKQASFLQGVTQNGLDGAGYCSQLGNNWCNFAYTLVGNNPTVGKPVKATPGSRVRTHYKLNASTQLWDQNVYINDKLVSTVSTSKGQHGWLFYISLECASGSCAKTPAHSWENVSITLSNADTSFGAGHSNGGWAYGASGGAMTTADGGKTWKFSALKIPATTVPRS